MNQLYLRKPEDLTLRDAPVPRAAAGELVVKVKGALTCGTDVKTYRRGHPKFPMPTPFGHEFAGDISEVGEGVEGWSVGEPVMLAPTAPCGACSDCARGLHNLCTFCMEGLILGAFAEYVRVPPHIVRTNLFRKPEELDYFEAAIMEPLACVVYGHQQLELKPQHTVVIVGAGPIGLLHQMLAQRSTDRVFMLGRRELRLSLARELGAEAVVEVNRGDSIVPIVRELTSGRGADCVIECTGQPEVWLESIQATAPQGTTMLFGGCKSGSHVNIPAGLLVNRNLTVKGVFHFTPAAVAESRRLLIGGDLPVKRMITEVRPMTDYQAIFRDLMAGKAIKYGIRPEL